MVKLSLAAIVEEGNLQLVLQVTLHLTHLQSSNAISTVHTEVLLVICAVRRLPWQQAGEKGLLNNIDVQLNHNYTTYFLTLLVS